MKNKTTESTAATSLKRIGLNALLLASLTLLPCLSVRAADDFFEHDPNDDETHYQQFNLVSDLFGVAQIQDTNLVNAWGIAFAPNGPFWIGDNGSGKATLYAVTNDATGAPHVTRNARVVTIPGNGRVTGVANNSTAAFNGDLFIFVSMDGTISGWRPALGNAAEVLATRNTAVYTGVALATNSSGPVLFAANFSEGTLDEYDAGLQLIGRFTDRRAPRGYSPFNVQNVGGFLFVTFAKLDPAKPGVAAGHGRGLIDIFAISTGRFHRFATGKAAGGNIRQMNAPWGVTLAPASFGSHADQLLVGNFGSGTIMSFDFNGRFRGLLKSSEECPITIDGLWGLTFGASGSSGVATDLYFTAGIDNETHGLFGVIQTESDADQNDQE